jgi:soluble lytic murein transglycosylase-like protein
LILRAAVLTALLTGVAARAGAELVLLTNGYTFAATAHAVDGDDVQLFLVGGGEVRLACADVAAIVPDEVVREKPASVPEAAEEAIATQDWRAAASDAARRHRVDAQLVAAVIAVESGFQSDAVSPKGAMGLMQLMPTTAAELGVTNPFDPKQNIEGGVRHLRALLTRYSGDRRLALAAYNAGVAAVERHRGIPPYSETRAYVRKVLARCRRARQ